MINYIVKYLNYLKINFALNAHDIARTSPATFGGGIVKFQL